MPHAGLRMLACDLVAPAGEGKGVVVADHARLHVAQDRGQFQIGRQGTMLVGKIGRRLSEALVPLGPVLFLQKGIGRL